MLKRVFSMGVVMSLLMQVTLVEAKWQESVKSSAQSEILTKVENLVKSTKNPVVVFDLDSTLYKNHARWAKIVQEFGATKKIQQYKSFLSTQITDAWDMNSVLGKDAGVDEKTVAGFIDEFKDFWGQRFFHDDYVGYDEALPGSVEYVNQLHKLGATIVYISGRDAPNMQKGSLIKLKADGYPVGVERTEIIFKPFSNSELKKQTKTKDEYAALVAKTDAEFKASAVSKAKSLGTVVASFDNDPTHINIYFNSFHKDGVGVAVWLDTDHAPNPPTLEAGIAHVSGFLR